MIVEKIFIKSTIVQKKISAKANDAKKAATCGGYTHCKSPDAMSRKLYKITAKTSDRRLRQTHMYLEKLE